MSQVPFVVLTITRSGSTWLVSLLDAQPGLTAYGELFLDQPGSTFIEQHQGAAPPPRFSFVKEKLGSWRWLQLYRYFHQLGDAAAPHEAYGFKLMLHRKTLDILAMLVVQRYRLICLVRDNVFEGAVSRLVLELTGQAHGSTAAAEQRFRLDPGALVREMQKRRRGIDGLHTVSRLWPWPALVVRYDELREHQQATLERILRLLGRPQPALSVASPLVRRIQRPYDELFENVDELVAAVDRARLSAHLPASLQRRLSG
jgi:LPS sulfotransferase NodH